MDPLIVAESLEDVIAAMGLRLAPWQWDIIDRVLDQPADGPPLLLCEPRRGGSVMHLRVLDELDEVLEPWTFPDDPAWPAFRLVWLPRWLERLVESRVR